MQVKDASPRMALAVVVLLGLLLALHVNVWPLIGPVALLLILVAAMSCILTGKFPKHFFGVLTGLLIGPFFFCYLFSVLFATLRPIFGSGVANSLFVLILVALMLISFLYVRWRLTRRKSPHPNQLQTNERKPLLPVRGDAEDKVEQCAVSESSSDSSGTA